MPKGLGNGEGVDHLPGVSGRLLEELDVQGRADADQGSSVWTDPQPAGDRRLAWGGRQAPGTKQAGEPSAQLLSAIPSMRKKEDSVTLTDRDRKPNVDI